MRNLYSILPSPISQLQKKRLLRRLCTSAAWYVNVERAVAVTYDYASDHNLSNQ